MPLSVAALLVDLQRSPKGPRPAPKRATDIGQARLHVIAAAAAALGFIGAGLSGSAPVDAMGSATGPRADVGVAILLVAISIGTGTAVVHRQRVFPDAAARPASPTPSGRSLPGVQEAQARRQRRAEYRSLAAEDVVLAREMGLGRPDRTPAFDDGGLIDLNALGAADLERYAGVTAAEAASSSAPAKEWRA